MHTGKEKQQGFIILMGMLALVLGAAVWFGTLGNLRSNTMSISHEDKNIAELNRIKDRMLAYAVLHPEIYSDATNIPGPGYFPCPDVDGDGNSDTSCDVDGAGINRLFVLGKVPYKIGTRYFTFLDSKLDNSKFWYAVDSRFVNSSARFATSISQRYSTLNINIANVMKDAGSSDVFPMTLDGKEDIVMVLFYSGEPLSGQTRPSNVYSNYLEQPTVSEGYTIDFRSVGAGSSVFNDYVIAITRSEWQSAILSRVTIDKAPEDGIPDLCVDLADTDISWFNECKYTGANIPPFTDSPFPATCPNTTVIAEENITGQNWRSIICP
ncbi:hypothetical protein [Thiomicrorhabdus sp. Milos-T2]|uniref:hypothetical protein n=1 Tax=Thiomicrorhabdus sp. Milos-T2 TaxID=90814 RepID=UPI000493D713|nr:hypothetical protein [Thiomicrorhabdus sp. Milos-T2]